MPPVRTPTHPPAPRRRVHSYQGGLYIKVAVLWGIVDFVGVWGGFCGGCHTLWQTGFVIVSVIREIEGVPRSSKRREGLSVLELLELFPDDYSAEA